ncbi:MAG: prephenate dehydrogenase/arogenate dehydrogenase family protein [Mariprofundaceae bacterium]
MTGSPLPRLLIVGVGLMGGSLAKALRRAGVVSHITGVGRQRANLERAQELGVIDQWSHDLAEVAAHADWVVICVPVRAYGSIFSTLARHAKPSVIITDAGSTKQNTIRMAHAHLGDMASQFIPAHPIAGTENSGVDAAFAELFDHHLTILTPEDHCSPQARMTVEKLWEAAGSHVESMSAREHDALLATVSHLPHIAAYALVNAVRKLGQESEYDPFHYAAGGFRDFTRIASSSPEMWRDISLANKDALIHTIDALQAELSTIRKQLEAKDGEGLCTGFSTAKNARDTWIKGGNASE